MKALLFASAFLLFQTLAFAKDHYETMDIAIAPSQVDTATAPNPAVESSLAEELKLKVFKLEHKVSSLEKRISALEKLSKK